MTPQPGRRPWRRPPWWPEGEPWPPRGGRRFPIRRAGCLLTALVLLAAVVVALSALLVASAAGITRAGGAAFVLLLAVAAALAVRSVSLGRALRSTTARLGANEERRRSFLADVTHELRTPLAVIRGQAEAIADGVYPGDAEHLAPIVDAVRSLEVLTEDLRTLALSDAGSLVLRREHVDVAALAHDAVTAFRTQAEAAGVTLTTESGDDVPQADADPARLRGVIANLLANALRHTHEGGSITVGVRRSVERVELEVADTGDGIPPELLPHVFERFVKGSSSNGSGLGLAIARDVVVAHGGTIDIASEAGEGTTVRVELPGISAR
jgi:two-component system sensor histidine kinase BaeS